MNEAIVECIDLSKHYESSGGNAGLFRSGKLLIRAVDGVSFKVTRGETFALVGTTGSGKTTTGRMILGLIRPTGGKIIVDGQDLRGLKGKKLHQVRREMQSVFQDPTASLNSRMRIVDTVGLPLQSFRVAKGSEKRSMVIELLNQVGLIPAEKYIDQYPAELSGGQRQRVAIARAIALKPSLIVLDEPVSALDASVRANILNLLQDLKQKYGLSYILISHDLSMVRWMSDTIAIMCRGKIIEMGKTETIFSEPIHVYTKALLAAIPIPDPLARTEKIKGIDLDLSSITAGELVNVGPHHFVREAR